MKKIKRKVISGGILSVCAVIGLLAISKLNSVNEKGAIPAALIETADETPIIIIDAGHGE